MLCKMTALGKNVSKIRKETFAIESFFSSSLLEVFCGKTILETSQNSRENTCIEVSFLINDGFEFFI